MTLTTLIYYYISKNYNKCTNINYIKYLTTHRALTGQLLFTHCRI
jgi:hypothetical protein